MAIKLRTDGACCPSSCDEKDRFVEINIPTDANTALSVDVGDDVEVIVKGKVESVHASKGEDCWGAPGDIRLVVDSIKVEGKNAFAALVED